MVVETPLLQSLVFNKNGGYLTDRLNQQCYTNSRHKGFMSFKCFARHRPGSISFLHHAKFISELIRFPWVEIHPKHFKIKIKSMIPFMVKWEQTQASPTTTVFCLFHVTLFDLSKAFNGICLSNFLICRNLWRRKIKIHNTKMKQHTNLVTAGHGW